MGKILVKNSFTATSVPAGLSAGELAVNVTDRKLFVGNAVGGVVTLIDPNALVTSVNGATGAVTNINAATVTTTTYNGSDTWYPVFAGGAGNTALYMDNVTTPLSYVPSTGTLNIRNLNAVNGNTGTYLTTSAIVAANDLDQTDLSSNSLYHEAFTSNSFTVSSTNSLKLSGSTIQFYGSGWGYTFPASNGSANQVLTTDGATPATLSWATPSSGITTGVANTFTALQTFSAGITSTTLYASAGVTFNSTSAHTGLATFSGGLTASGATFSGNVNLQDNVLSRVELLDYFERYVDLGDFTNKGAQIPIDLSTGQVFRTKLTVAGIGLTLSNIPDNANANAVGFSLLFVGDGTARTFTWNIGSAGISWAAGTAPTYTSTANKVDIYSFLSNNGGSNWYGFVGGQNF